MNAKDQEEPKLPNQESDWRNAEHALDLLADAKFEARLTALHGEAGKQLLDRLRIPARTACFINGKLHIYERKALQFFRVWAETPEMLISEEDLVKMTAHVYAEIKYLTEWENDAEKVRKVSQWLCMHKPSKGYVYEGLNALFQLFAEETQRNASFRMLPPQAFPEAAKYPPGTFKPGDLSRRPECFA